MKLTSKEKTGIELPEEKNKWDRPRKVKKWFSLPQATVLKYTLFKEKKLNRKNIMTRNKADLFLRTYFRLVMCRIIAKGFIFTMPYSLGKFHLVKIDRNGFLQNTKQKTLNLHSFRKFMTIRWGKTSAFFKNRGVWKYSLSDDVKGMITAFARGKDIYDTPVEGRLQKIENATKLRKP